MPKPYYRAIPARGTHPGAYSDAGAVFEHDPRGYHPDWQTGWQTGYTHGYGDNGYGAHAGRVPAAVDEQQYTDGYVHGRNVGIYHWWQHTTDSTAPVPSPWWRKPDAEPSEGYQSWRVVIEIDVPGSSPRAAAENAWAALGGDGPPRVAVYPLLGSPGDAVDIDLADTGPEQ